MKIRIEKECRIASPFRARPPLLQREVITEFMKGRIYRKRENLGTAFFLPPTFPIINPHKCFMPRKSWTIQLLLINISTSSRLANCELLSRGERRTTKEKLRKNLHEKKCGATSHKQAASRYFRQSSAGNSSNASRTTRFHSSPFDEVPAAIRPRQRVNVEYHRRGNGVSLFLRWEGRKGRNVTIGSERSPSRGEEIRSSTIRVVYAKYGSLFCLYLSLSLLSRENSWIQSERGISTKGLFLSRNNTCGK